MEAGTDATGAEGRCHSVPVGGQGAGDGSAPVAQGPQAGQVSAWRRPRVGSWTVWQVLAGSGEAQSRLSWETWATVVPGPPRRLTRSEAPRAAVRSEDGGDKVGAVGSGGAGGLAGSGDDGHGLTGARAWLLPVCSAMAATVATIRRGQRMLTSPLALLGEQRRGGRQWVFG